MWPALMAARRRRRYDAGRGGLSSIAGVILGRFGSGHVSGTSRGYYSVDGYPNQLNANLSVIHFNWGLHDIDPHMLCTHISLPNIMQHGKLYLTFKRAALAATVVFQTTTPVPPSYTLLDGQQGRRVAINGVANTIWAPPGIYRRHRQRPLPAHRRCVPQRS